MASTSYSARDMCLILVILISIGAVRPSSIVEPPTEVTGQLGKTAEFTCEVEFVGIPVLSWEFNGAVIYSLQIAYEDYPMGKSKYSVTHNRRKFTLRVKQLQFNDGGIYTCRVLMQAKKAHLIIIDTPQIWTSTPHPVENSTAEYSCTTWFSGPSKKEIRPEQYPHLRMFFDGDPLNDTVEEQGIGDITNYYNLTLDHNITLDASIHRKELLCVIETTSPPMQLNSSTEIRVIYPVRHIGYTPHRKVYQVGSVINCTADASPEPFFVWDNPETGNTTPGRLLHIVEKMVGSNTWICTANNTVTGHSYYKTVIAVFEVPPENAVKTVTKKKDIRITAVELAVGIVITICFLLLGLTVLWWLQ